MAVKSEMRVGVSGWIWGAVPTLLGLTCRLRFSARHEQEMPNWKMKTRPRMIMYWGQSQGKR